jgi:hypothetical protein
MLATAASAGSTIARTSPGAGTVTDVHGQLVQIEEHPHGAPSGQSSSVPPSVHSAATSAIATVNTPLIDTSKAAIRRHEAGEAPDPYS